MNYFNILTFRFTAYLCGVINKFVVKLLNSFSEIFHPDMDSLLVNVNLTRVFPEVDKQGSCTNLFTIGYTVQCNGQGKSIITIPILRF